MNEPYHIFKDGTKLMLIRDDMPESPREWDNLGTMICFHKRYTLGDKHEYKAGDFNSTEEIEDQIYKDHDPLVVLPLYLYDHSGITMNTTGFSCRFDSCQVGFIYISKEKVRVECGVKRISKKLKERICGYLVGEVETYDQFLTGDIWGFQFIDTNEDDIDSCYGFYGDDPMKNGMIDHFEEKYRIELKEGVCNVCI